MWCPSCGAEYRPGFTRCPDCDLDLVVEPPPEPEPDPSVHAPLKIDLENLGPAPEVVFAGAPPEADMMRAVLEGSGIACVVWSSGLEHSYGGIEPHRLLVRERDAERAREIIAAARAGDLDLDAPAVDEAYAVEEASEDWVSPSEPVSHATGPITEVDAWWKHPELPKIVSTVAVLAGITIVVGLAYLILKAVAE